MIFAVIGLVSGGESVAQLQDNCFEAGNLSIGEGGQVTVTYSTEPAAINTATVRPSEFFAYAPLLSGRSLWCRFTLPMLRRVTLQLSTAGIGNSSDLGWTCCRVSSPADCHLGYDEAQAAYFTPIQGTASSMVACLPQGEYLLQVTADFGVGTGAVIMNLTIELPDTICDPFAGMSSASIGGTWVNVWPSPSHGEFMLEGTDLGVPRSGLLMLLVARPPSRGRAVPVPPRWSTLGTHPPACMSYRIPETAKHGWYPY